MFASVENVDSALAIVAEAEPVAADTRIAPLAATVVGRAGESLAEEVGIRVTDSSGRVLSDIPVRWTVVEGGTVEAGSARTDSLGVARARWVLGAKTGTQRIRAHVGNGPGSRSIVPVTITATALAGAPVALLVESGDKQKGTAGEKLGKSIVVRVVDANGSGVSEAALDLSPSSGVASDSVIRTDSLGRARIGWTMGRSAGAHSLAVRVEGVKTVLKISAEARAGRPANLSFDDVIRHAKANRSADRTKRLYAVVSDLYGNPVPDARVSFTASSGTVNPKRAVSDAKGRAELTWKIGIKPGEHVLLGRVGVTDVKGDYRIETAAPAVPKPQSVKAKQSGKQAFRARSEVAQIPE
jgi:protocatechuate 3,4-dioxygenase beta subunit